jgi:FkbM family methyltransferase
MGADSLARRVIKNLLYPVLTEDRYAYVVALSKAWDIRTNSDSEPEIDLIPLAVRKGDTVVDLGANFGYYTYPLSRAVGPSGRVFAFEPIPFTCQALELVARLLRLRNVEIVPKGCSDRAGAIMFEVPIQANGAPNAGQAYISGRNEDRPGKDTQVRWKGTRQVKAEVLRLDDFLPSVSDLSFIKADIEGAELFAFRGGEQTISKHLPTVLCEINPWFLDGFGVKLDELMNFFFERGYRLYHYQDHKLRVIPVSAVVEDNYVFVHPSRVERLRVTIED